MHSRKIYIIIMAISLGALGILQGRSFKTANEIFVRDTSSNIFQDIKILKDKNKDLKSEIDGLENTLHQLNDQNLAVDAIEEEISRYKKLSGQSPIFGKGFSITIDGTLSTAWMVDFINEILNSGTQAVSVNGIRITNLTYGFDTLPQGQILINGSILSSPYVFNVIGDSVTIRQIIELPGGIIDRLNAAQQNINVSIADKDIIQMD